MTVLLSSQTIKSTVQVRGRLEKVTVGQLLDKFTAVYGDPPLFIALFTTA